MGQKLMDTLALPRFSFKRPANTKIFTHTLDRAVNEAVFGLNHRWVGKFSFFFKFNNRRRFPDFAVIADLWILTFVLAPQS